MTDNWAAGDLALCVRGGRIASSNGFEKAYPKSGRIYEVEQVRVENMTIGPTLSLVLKDGPLNFASVWGRVESAPVWAAFRFRKIHPLTEAEREEALRELTEPVKEPLDRVRMGGRP